MQVLFPYTWLDILQFQGKNAFTPENKGSYKFSTIIYPVHISFSFIFYELTSQVRPELSCFLYQLIWGHRFSLLTYTEFNYIYYFQIKINTDSHGNSFFYLYFLVDYLNVLRLLYWEQGDRRLARWNPRKADNASSLPPTHI